MAATDEGDTVFGFSPPHDRPIPYLERISTYYQTLGYGKPYQWAHYARAPFQALAKPLSESRVALVTTASPFDPDNGDQGPWSAYNAKAKFYKVYSGPSDIDPDLRISHVGIDRQHTSQEDSRTWFPLAALRQAADDGRIGEVAPRFHGLPTNRSHRTTIETDCAELLSRIREDKADVAILVAN